MQVRLYSGQIQGGQPIETGAALPTQLDRACRFVYDGIFKSMDGEVRITTALMQRIAAAHNSRVVAAGGELPIGACPPVQLDHTKSARDTVGRVVGLLTVAPQMIEVEPGRTELKDALLGTVRFLGADNVERAIDGRFSTVSIGANLETGTLDELSVTPFPAATHATLLSRGEDQMDKEKLKKHLMKTAKCTAEEADEKLAKMSDDDQKKLSAEADEDEKKLAAEEDEKAKKLAAEEEEKKNLAAADEEEKESAKKLAAAKPKLARLMGEANEAVRLARLEAKRAEVGVHLSKFRAQGVLTPAEEKKLSAELTVGGKKIRLSDASDEALALAWAILEAREPVVTPGQVGSVKAVDLSQVGESAKKVRLAAQETATLSNMPFTSRMLKNMQGEAGEGATARPADAAALAAVVTETETHVTSVTSIESHQKQLAALQEQIAKLAAFTTAIAEALA